MTIKDRLRKLEQQQSHGAARWHVFSVGAEVEDQLEPEIARRTAAGEIAPGDLVVGIREFGSPEENAAPKYLSNGALVS